MNKEELDQLWEKLDWELIPEYMRQSIKDWMISGWAPGEFVLALLRHDLQAAVWLTDEEPDQYDLAKWVKFLKDVPAECHGSDAKVMDWHARGGYQGIKK